MRPPLLLFRKSAHTAPRLGFAIVVIGLWASACNVPAQARYPADVATALREQDMQTLETSTLKVYYPKHRKEAAHRIAERVEGCANQLRSQTLIHNSYADQKMTIVIPDLPFNNAFVAPSALGSEHFSVIPTSNTLDFASELGVPPDPSYVGCHEVVHYLQFLQVSGFWGWINRAFGDVISPHIGMDGWFAEGLATYYESKLQPGTGRMAWPAWRGVFHAGFAENRLSGGDLSSMQRTFHWGNQYLVGSHFVEFIAQRYGEKALWKIIERQGDSILFPFGVALRWKSATGKSLPTLIDEFADAVEEHFPKRTVPMDQRTIRSAGSAARYAISLTGREALLVASPDLSSSLRIYDQGKLLRERDLVNIVPPRTLVVSHPIMSSGLSFTDDGKLLYFVAIDVGANGQESRLLRYDVDRDSLEVVVPELKGTGGGVSGDGKTFYYSYADGDKRHAAALDLASGEARILRTAKPRHYYDQVRPSPDGKQVATALFKGQRFVIQVLDATSGKTAAEIPFLGAVHDPSWLADQSLLLLAEHEGRFQVHRYDLTTRVLERLTNAPYLAFQPRMHDGKLRFLSRKDWHWTVDEVDLPQTVAADHIVAPATAEQIAQFPEPTNAELQVVSDKPYSQLDGLFIPHYRVPLLISSVGASLVGLQVSGTDPLGFHRWGLFGQYDLLGEHISGGAQYGTGLLAPFNLDIAVQHLAWNPPVTEDDMTISKGPFRSQSDVALSLSRSLRTTSFSLGLLGQQQEDHDFLLPSLRSRKLAGPTIALGHNALRSTAHAGFLQGYAAEARAAYFDKSLSTFDVGFADLSAQLELRSSLPLSPKHTLGLQLRGHAIVGFERDRSFLVVGSANNEGELWSESDRDAPDEPFLPGPAPLRSFQQPLRGFENLAFVTDRIGIVDLTYRMPITIDRGFASTLYVLPSWFFRQLDLEIFATGATDSFKDFENRHHLAAGGSVAVSSVVWLVPLRLRYQLARRFTDDEATTHLLTLGI